MKFGDISNEPVPKVAFRFEEIIRRERDGILNRTGKAFLENLAHTDFQIVLFTTGDSRKAQAYCYKWSVPYSRVCAVDSILDLIHVVRESNIVAYWDVDKDILSKIHQRAKTGLEVKFWTLQGNSFLE